MLTLRQTGNVSSPLALTWLWIGKVEEAGWTAVTAHEDSKKQNITSSIKRRSFRGLCKSLRISFELWLSIINTTQTIRMDVCCEPCSLLFVFVCVSWYLMRASISLFPPGVLSLFQPLTLAFPFGPVIFFLLVCKLNKRRSLGRSEHHLFKQRVMNYLRLEINETT